MSEPKLLRCPFCGGEASIESDLIVGRTWVECQGCSVETAALQFGTLRQRIKAAAERWNNRAKPEHGEG